MSPVLRELRNVQRSMRANRALETFSKAMLVCLLCECGMAAGFKITFGVMPQTLLALGLAIPVAVALATSRRITLAFAAAAADRELRLDERLSTSLEVMDGKSLLAGAVVRDAERALGRADLHAVKRLRQPRELYFAIAAGLVLAAILLAPDPVDSQEPPALPVGLKSEIHRLEEKARSFGGSPIFAKTREKLAERIKEARRDPKKVEDLIREITIQLERIAARLENPNVSREEWRQLEAAREALLASGAGLASRMPGPAAQKFFEPGPTVQAKFSREGAAPPAAAEPRGVGPQTSGPGDPSTDRTERLRQVLQERGWPPRLDPVVLRFLGVEP